MHDEPKAMAKVPQARGSMPNFGGVASGFSSVPRRNSRIPALDSMKNSTVWMLSTSTIPSVVSTVTTAQKARTTAIASSQKARKRECPDQRYAVDGSSGFITAAESAADRSGVVTFAVLQVRSARRRTRQGPGRASASRRPEAVGSLAGGGWLRARGGCGRCCLRSRVELGQRVLVLFQLVRGWRIVSPLDRKLLDVVQIEVEELLDLWAPRRRVLDIDEQGAREGLVRLVGDRLGTGQHGFGLGTVLNRDGPQPPLVGGIVGVAKVTHTVRVIGDAVHERVVVRALLHVVALALRLADDRLGEELERSRVVVGGVENDLAVGPGGIEVLPGLDAGAGLPELLELVDGERLHECVLGIDHHGDAVVADEEPRPLDPPGLGLRLLVRLGCARRVDDVHLALEVATEPAAGPMIVHDHGDIRIDRLERFLGGLADPIHGAGPIHDDRGGLLASFRSGGGVALMRPAASKGQARQGQTGNCQLSGHQEHRDRFLFLERLKLVCMFRFTAPRVTDGPWQFIHKPDTDNDHDTFPS